MDPGLVSSLSGALAQSRRVDKIANNLANADTPAFKADDLSFEEVLQNAHQVDSRSDIPEQPYNESEVLSRAGDENRAVLYGHEFTDLRAGAFRQTSNPLDVAIEGNGFLEVLTPKGIRLTRAGNLTLDSQGRLTTRDGFLVLSAGQQNRNPANQNPTEVDPAQAAARAITLPRGKIDIDIEGNISTVNGEARQVLSRLSVVQVENPVALKKDGANVFEAPQAAFAAPAPTVTRAPAGMEAEFEADPNAFQPAMKANPLGATNQIPRVHQGMLESSNVNPVHEMTKLIEAQRLFDQNVKIMQNVGDLNGRISELGKF